MKRILTILCVLFTLSHTVGQIDARDWLTGQYDQEWFKFDVEEAGIYRITATELSAWNVDLNAFIGANLKVYRNGAEIPILVSTPGSFSSQDYIEFYAYGEDGELDQHLYIDTNHLPHKKKGLFHDVATYYLTWDELTNHMRIVDSVNVLTNLPTVESHCYQKSEYLPFSSFESGLIRPSGDITYVLSDFEEGEGFYGPNISTTATVDLSISSLDINHGDAFLEIQMVGRNDFTSRLNEHHFSFSIGSYEYDTLINGLEHVELRKAIPINDVSDVTTQIEVSNFRDLYDASLVSISYAELTYPSTFNAVNKASFEFYLDQSNNDKAYVEILNLGKQTNDKIYLYDFHRQVRLEAFESGNESQVNLLKSNTSSERKYLIVSEGGMGSVSNFKRVDLINYSDVANQGDFVILVADTLLKEDSTWLNELMSHKSQDYTPIVITASQLFDHWSYGKKLHPLSIVNMVDEMEQEWFYDVKYISIYGLATPYSSRNNYQTYCQVPSFGHNPSDIMLACKIGSYVPQIPIGRVAAVNAEEASAFTAKLIEHVNNLNTYENTKEGKEWMKQIIHLGGGANEAEQSEFALYLEEFEQIIENSIYGGNVHTFLKNSSDPIQVALSETFDTLIANGVSMITFFGHSSATTLEFSIYNPENHENNGKYPLVISNGCLAGDIHRIGKTASKDFVLIKDKGAIGFLASTYYSFASYDYEYTKSFYDRFGNDQYGAAIGDIMKGVIEENLAASSDPITVYSTQLITLHGDPSVTFNAHEKPDYVIENEDVSVFPENVSIDSDTFQVKLIITNIGRAVEDSFYIKITRGFPDQSSAIVYNDLHPGVYYKDTVSISLNIEPERALGLNSLDIVIDPIETNAFGNIDELEDVLNNRVGLSFVILSDDIVPIYPYEFSKVTDDNVVLKASTVNLFAEESVYRFQIDTVKSFNSSSLRECSVTSIGGYIEWDINDLDLIENQTYFWRTSVDTSVSSEFNWFMSSFYLDKDGNDGWRQSNIDQFEENTLSNIVIEDDQLAFIGDVKDFNLFTYNLSEQPTSNNRGSDIGWSLNGVQIQGKMRGFTLDRNLRSGIAISVFDTATLLPLDYESGYMGSINVKTGNIYQSLSFVDFDLNDTTFLFDSIASIDEQTNISSFLESIPDKYYVLAYIVSGTNTIPKKWQSDLKNHFINNGSQYVDTLGEGLPWMMFYKKNDPSYTPVETVGDSKSGTLNVDFWIEGAWNSGNIRTNTIGPARSWGELKFSQSSLETMSYDETNVDVYARNMNGEETLILSGLKGDTSLSFISAIDYPYLNLRWNTVDDTMRSPAQLDFWELDYEIAPELALAPNYMYTFYEDSLQEGDSVRLKLRVENASLVNFDNVLVDYSIINHNNQLQPVKTELIDSLLLDDSLTLDFTMSTLDLKNNNRLVVSVNPEMTQLEQVAFNNIAVVPFYVNEDNANPLLDVTFDGVHIIDGDYVSANPFIMIRLRDDNEFVPINDTSLFNLFIEDPNGSIQKLSFNQSDLLFLPALDGGDNVAEIQYTPNFEDEGVYKLSVQGRDRAGNMSGYFDYSISFTISKASTITRVFNYPNPFTTSTRFVFELTGTQVPDYFKIQIMTIRGKVIREIELDEIDDIHIGRNITNFSWDGTDEFGDPVGNGVYLYKVVAKINGENIELNTKSGTEQYFHSGIGKMTLIR